MMPINIICATKVVVSVSDFGRALYGSEKLSKLCRGSSVKSLED